MASMWALEAMTSAVSSSRPDSEALPDSSRRASTRWSCFAIVLRAATASGASFSSSAAAFLAS